MQREKIIVELQVWAIFLFMAGALLVSICYNVRQKERIENYQYMMNSLPADLRDQEGNRRPCHDTRTKSAFNN